MEEIFSPGWFTGNGPNASHPTPSCTLQEDELDRQLSTGTPINPEQLINEEVKGIHSGRVMVEEMCSALEMVEQKCVEVDSTDATLRTKLLHENRQEFIDRRIMMRRMRHDIRLARNRLEVAEARLLQSLRLYLNLSPPKKTRCPQVYRDASQRPPKFLSEEVEALDFDLDKHSYLSIEQSGIGQRTSRKFFNYCDSQGPNPDISLLRSGHWRSSNEDDEKGLPQPPTSLEFHSDLSPTRTEPDFLTVTRGPDDDHLHDTGSNNIPYEDFQIGKWDRMGCSLRDFLNLLPKTLLLVYALKWFRAVPLIGRQENEADPILDFWTGLQAFLFSVLWKLLQQAWENLVQVGDGRDLGKRRIKSGQLAKDNGSRTRPRILFVCPDPSDQSSLRLLDETRALMQTLQKTKLFDLVTLPSCRPTDLEHAVHEHKPKSILFSCHGSKAGLCFQNDAGRSKWVSSDDLAPLLGLANRRGLSSVFLNFCNSAELASSIAQAGCSVIAMKGPVSDTAAVAFSRSFYTAYGQGVLIEEAFERAKAGASLETGHDSIQPILIKAQV